MEQKLYENLRENEKVLWTGKPEFKAFGATHKSFFVAKAVIVVAAMIAFFAYYFMCIKNGTTDFRVSVVVIMAILAVVPLVMELLDSKKMEKAIYAVTNQRMISIIDGAVNTVEYDKVKEYKFAEDADGQTSLVCGCDMMKKSPRTYRASAVYGLRMTADGSACERFVLYAIPEANKVKKLVDERIH